MQKWAKRFPLLNKFPKGAGSVLVILLGTLYITYNHYTVPEHFSAVHLSHYYAFYLLVIYAAYQFAFWGGLATAVLLTFIYDIRVYEHLFMLDMPHHMVPATVEVSMIIAVGLVAGYFSSKLKREKEKVEQVSAEMLMLERQVARDDRLRVLGQLSAGIAHEIRNPLAAIKSGVAMVKSGKGNDTVLDILQSEIERLDGFVGRFLQYARFGKNESIEFELKPFVQELLELVKLMAKRKEVAIVSSLHIPDGYVVVGDKNAVKQALVNVLINGVEALETVENAEIQLHVTADGEKVVFIVEDNGPGIQPQDAEKIFEPFYTTKADGTGLGLSLAFKIVKEHGGDLMVENTGQGARFTITIARA